MTKSKRKGKEAARPATAGKPETAHTPAEPGETAPPSPTTKGKVGRPLGWKPGDHGADPGGRPVEWTTERIEATAADLLEWFKDDKNLFFEKFAHERDMAWSYLVEVGKGNHKFSAAYARVKEIQRLRLAEGGLTGKYNPQMTYNTLKNVSGWRDKTEVEHSGKVNQIVRYHRPERRKL